MSQTVGGAVFQKCAVSKLNLCLLLTSKSLFLIFTDKQLPDVVPHVWPRLPQRPTRAG